MFLEVSGAFKELSGAFQEVSQGFRAFSGPHEDSGAFRCIPCGLRWFKVVSEAFTRSPGWRLKRVSKVFQGFQGYFRGFCFKCWGS